MVTAPNQSLHRRRKALLRENWGQIYFFRMMWAEWPIELVIAAVVGLIASSAGALIGSVPALMSRQSSSDQNDR